MEEKGKKKEKKGSKVLNILLFAILLLLGLATSSYACFKLGYQLGSIDSRLEKTEVKEQKKKYEVPDGLTENSQIIKDIMDPFMKANCNVDLSKLDETETRMQIAMAQTLKGEILCKDLDLKYFFDKDGNPYVCNEIIDTQEAQFKADESKLTSEKTFIIDADELKVAYEKIFGLNSNYSNKDFKYFNRYYKYNGKLNKFIEYTWSRTGGKCVPNETPKITSATQNGKNLSVTLKYKTFEETYNFIFEEETGNYIFESIVK